MSRTGPSTTQAAIPALSAHRAETPTAAWSAAAVHHGDVAGLGEAVEVTVAEDASPTGSAVGGDVAVEASVPQGDGLSDDDVVPPHRRERRRGHASAAAELVECVGDRGGGVGHVPQAVEQSGGESRDRPGRDQGIVEPAGEPLATVDAAHVPTLVATGRVRRRLDS